MLLNKTKPNIEINMQKFELFNGPSRHNLTLMSGVIRGVNHYGSIYI